MCFLQMSAGEKPSYSTESKDGRILRFSVCVDFVYQHVKAELSARCYLHHASVSALWCSKAGG